MWKDYSSGYIKNNRASGISVKAAALISALLLSLLCAVFYNLWYYEAETVKAEEGSWQARIAGEIDEKAMASIQNYASVEQAVINQELSDGAKTAVDIYFKNIRTVLKDMPRIANLCGLSEESVTYHYSLLNLYLVRDPKDPAPRLIFPFFLAVTVLSCISLILIIHNSFAVSMQARIHQFGIFSSIGATPGQIRTCLLQEAAALCILPAVAGNLLGIAACMGIIEGINMLLADVEGRLAMPFTCHPLVPAGSFLAAVLTIWISAWIPAAKMSRMTPLEAVRNTGEFQLERKKESRILSRLFGIEGELAGNALKARKKALRTAAWSLTLSFLAFSLMMCFFTLSEISQRMTYFERYQNAWDVMITVKNAREDIFKENDRLQQISGIRSSVIYQKAKAKYLVQEADISDQMRGLESFAHASKQYVTAADDGWLVNAPLVILDDDSFLAFCEQTGAGQRLDGAIILNQTADVSNPNFRNREKIPYLKEQRQTSVLWQAGQEYGTKAGSAIAEIPVLAYTQEVPKLREEYGTLDFYELVHFLPESVWKEIKEKTGETQEDVLIRILADEGATLADLKEIEKETAHLLDGKYEIEMENRIQEKMENDDMFGGMRLILGGFCVLLAMIGISSVFSNTFGFVQQRKREFARYLSVGMTPEGIWKMFCIEALVTAGRPVMVTLPVVAAAAGFMLKLSYLEPVIFIREAPVVPVVLFVLAVFGFVGLAYYLGGKRVLSGSLDEVLRDDTML